MSAYQNAFVGLVDQNEYTQVYDFAPLYSSTGSYLGRELVTQKVIEKTYRFNGLSYTEAHTTNAQSVIDINGNTVSVPFQSSFRDGSTGTKVFEVYSCNVVRTRISPHLWDVSVKVRESEYFVNGVKIDFPND